MWKLIDSLKLIIHHQTAVIELTKAEIEEVKRDQNVLRHQNEKLHEEVRAPRAQMEATPPAPPPRSWAAVAADGNNASLDRRTVETNTVWFHSLIYVNRNASTSSYRQIRCDYPDITAIKIWTAHFQFLIFLFISLLSRSSPDMGISVFTASQPLIKFKINPLIFSQ